MPTKEQVKNVVFNLSGDSVSGPDCFTSLFDQYYWDIVGDDVWKLVFAFFEANTLPKYITHSNLVLMPKKITRTLYVT